MDPEARLAFACWALSYYDFAPPQKGCPLGTVDARSVLDLFRCSWTGDTAYLLSRFDALQGYGGLLEELRQRCFAQGYTESFYPDYGPTNCAVRIELRKGIGGFCLVYNSR